MQSDIPARRLRFNPRPGPETSRQGSRNTSQTEHSTVFDGVDAFSRNFSSNRKLFLDEFRGFALEVVNCVGQLSARIGMEVTRNLSPFHSSKSKSR